MMVDQRLVYTLVVIVVVIAFRLVLGGIFKRKLRELTGHHLLANTLTGILIIGLAFYLLYLWGIIQALVEIALTLGVITVVFLFTIKDIWISNLFAGISLIGDKLINIGSEVEVGGRKGKIVEMTLTVTKVRTSDNRLMIVPNKKFREEIVVITKRR
ncbi:MAG: mechanosensitive ion channel family protein [Hadesarchaea archaeon]|nr:mechanosensitive ion channel family protein [Hadesarchaea archaeon]MDH5685831.1 mechanosensitive ion channel family protein [Hadesarchaea archaeon]